MLTPASSQRRGRRRIRTCARFFDRAHAAGALVMHMVSGVPEAVRAVDAGADVIVAQGTEGGGHVGWMGTLALVPQVVSAVSPVPVLAAARERNDPQETNLQMGQTAGLITEISPAADLVRRIVAEAERVIRVRLPGLVAD